MGSLKICSPLICIYNFQSSFVMLRRNIIIILLIFFYENEVDLGVFFFLPPFETLLSPLSVKEEKKNTQKIQKK